MATTLEMLIEAVKRGEIPTLPDPAAPMPLGVAAPPTTTMPPAPPPDLPPTAPLPAADTSFINQYAGPAPVAPVQRAPSTLEKIGAVLSGIGGGPDVAAQIREQRNEPIRRYERELERFQTRRTQGLEIDERRREREQDRATQQAIAKADREFQEYIRKSNITDKVALEQLQMGHELRKIREAERIADERLERQQQAAKEKQRNDIYAKLISQDFAPQRFANEIADSIVFGKPMSAAAEKWRSVKAQKLERQLASIGGGSGGSERAIVEVVDGQGQVLGRMPYSQIKFDNGTPAGFPGATLRFPQAQPATAPVSGASPEGFPLARGTAGAPGAFQETLSGGIQMTTPAAGPSDKEVKAYARRFKISPKKARQELMGQ